MKRFYFIVFALISHTVAGQGSIQQIIKADRNYECIYLHTDKEVYVTTEQIWYKLYLQNPQNNDNDLSAVAYVELTDVAGNTLIRNKQKCVDGMSYGSIFIPEELPSSIYLVKAYTRWMNNTGDNLSATNLVTIISDGDSILTLPPMMKNNSCSLIDHAVRQEDKVVVAFTEPFHGEIILHHRGVIMSEQAVINPKKSVELNAEIPSDETTLTVFDQNGNWICSKNVERDDKLLKTELILEMKDREIEPGNKVTLEIALKQLDKEKPTGNFSLSIFRDDKPGLESIGLKAYHNPIRVEDEIDVKLRKEMFLYPSNPNGLTSLEFDNHRMNTDAGGEVKALPSEWITERELVKAINKSYPETSEKKYDEISLPYDNRYDPAEYVDLPSVEDFFIEVIDQIKLKNKKGKKSIAIRNTEDKNNAFVYKKPPLILIDGYIYDNLDRVLALNPMDIEKITLSWKSNTLKKVSLVKLADHGIVSLYSKEGKQLIPRDSLQVNIYQDFHRPQIFPQNEKAGNKSRPDFGMRKEGQESIWIMNFPENISQESIAFANTIGIGSQVLVFVIAIFLMELCIRRRKE